MQSDMIDEELTLIWTTLLTYIFQMRTFGYFLIKIGQNLARTGQICDSIKLVLAKFIDGRSFAVRRHHTITRNGKQPFQEKKIW